EADAGGLAEAEIGELPDGLVGERAAAAHDADLASLVNVAGHDADLALAGRDDAGAIWTDESAFRVIALEAGVNLHHVEHGDALGDGDDQLDAGVGGFE